MTEMSTREYKSGDLGVLWQSELCTHCGNCQAELPLVFNPVARPWVDLDAAPSAKIRAVVLQCPSGALSLIPKAGQDEQQKSTRQP